MTYQEAREFIDSSNRYNGKQSLSAIAQLLKRLGEPQEHLKIIHVGGTNGKGSTAAYLAGVLAAQGYRTGRFISPSVFSYRECIQLDQEHIEEQDICDMVGIIKPVFDGMAKEEVDLPTPFELETAMAFLYFKRKQVDFAIMEVGMGGRLDATNVVKQPLLSIITSVSMDHMQFLGDTLEKIAREKAGIIKKQVPVIAGDTKPEAFRVIKQVCQENNSRLITATGSITDTVFSPEGTKFNYRDEEYQIRLLGEYQIHNAILAIEAVGELRRCGYPVSDDAVKDGLSNTSWGGRLEIIAKEPYFIIDGAHNEDAAIQLRNAINQVFPAQRKIFIMGVLADKDYKRILKLTASLADIIFTITPDNSRALDSGKLAKEAALFTKARVIDAQNTKKAVSCAYECAGKADLILAFGSLSFLKDIRQCVQTHRNSD